jgi:poly-beta-1,6-N-acetyl-D-glucosamine synthase
VIDLITIAACAGLIAYAYVLYPIIMRFWSARNGRSWKIDDSIRPSFSIILAVYNEESVLPQCLQAIASIAYPTDSIEILVGSDGSSDRTVAILREFANVLPNLTIYSFPQRRGKIPVVNDLVSHAHSELLFFTDADVTLDPLCLHRHARHYADTSLGGVAGNLLLFGEDEIRSEPLSSEQYYMSVENRLRMDEAKLHSTVGIFGGHYSIRRSLWCELPNKPICDELYIALNIIESGKRMVFEGTAAAKERFGRSMTDEFQRKARFAARGVATLQHFPRLLSPRSGWLSAMLWSHKLLRWLAPFAFAVLIGISIFAVLRKNPAVWVQPLVFIELTGLLLVIAGLILNVSRRPLPILSHVYWFALMNVAFAIGVLRFLFNREKPFWTQSTRVSEVTPLKDSLISKEVSHS